MSSDRAKKNAQQRARAKANRAAGKCACGRAQFNGTTSCEGCLTAQRASQRRRYAKNREKLCAESREWQKKNVDYCRDKHRTQWLALKADPEAFEAERRARRARAYKRKFGLTAEQVETMHAAQGGRCAICARPFAECGGRGTSGLGHVDHCHQTGRVRALLCFRCNTDVGKLETLESAGLLMTMCSYILRYRGAH